jgi:dipeptidyl aminopeptidase/acylaminoacyl peptidase
MFRMNWAKITFPIVTLLAGLAVMRANAASFDNPIVPRLTIPSEQNGPLRPITIRDVASVRVIDSLSVSPDGKSYAIFVHQADEKSNTYLTAWLVGSSSGGALKFVGDGGGLQTDGSAGELRGEKAQWSRDGQWIAYLKLAHGETQLWRSKSDGSRQEQITHNEANVLDFTWNRDGGSLFYTVDSLTKAQKAARNSTNERDGYRYNEDLWQFTDLLLPALRRDAPSGSTVWIVSAEGMSERKGTATEAANYVQLKGTETAIGPNDGAIAKYHGATVVLLENAVGGPTTLAVTNPGDVIVRCRGAACSGTIKRIWWSDDGRIVYFWKGEGLGNDTQAIYKWVPRAQSVELVLRSYDRFRDCQGLSPDRVACVIDGPTSPSHLISVNLGTGAVGALANVNPEYANISLGKAERIEWDTPHFAWNEPGGQLAGLYPKRAFGYILLPPNFDPSKKYPAIIEPYIAHGFNSSFGSEHALQAYAAEGFVVLNMNFPEPLDMVNRLGGGAMTKLYDPSLGYPHLTMLMESTVAGLDEALRRGFIDPTRIGIGGVSHGTFVPLYLIQKHNKIAAVSISSMTWTAFQYYWPTRLELDGLKKLFGKMTYDDSWAKKPDLPGGAEFWVGIDLADHVDDVEAPILMNVSAEETYSLVRLIRNLEDAHRSGYFRCARGRYMVSYREKVLCGG